MNLGKQYINLVRTSIKIYEIGAMSSVGATATLLSTALALEITAAWAHVPQTELF